MRRPPQGQGGSLVPDSLSTLATASRAVQDKYVGMPANVLRENFPLNDPSQSINGVGGYVATVATLASGSARVEAIQLYAGDVISTISFVSGTTAWSGGAGPVRFFALYDSAFNLLAYSADDGANSWSASTVKTLAIARNAAGSVITSYTIPTTGLYYLACIHSFGSGASNTFAGATVTNQAPAVAGLLAAGAVMMTGTKTSAISGGLPAASLATPTAAANRAYCRVA